jgi:hypothetical protein
MKDRKNLVLVLASTAAGLVLVEAGLRIFTPFAPGFDPLTAPAAPPVASSEMARVQSYVERLAAANGTDRAWFAQNPPAPPNRTAPAADLVALAADYQRRGLFPSQAEYVWNRWALERDRCNPHGPYRNFPNTVLVFTPPQPALNPRYRFRRNATLPSGLVTNAFGLRGHPIDLVKPAKTVRIAFLGASTTVGYHGYAFSYPEFVEFWLNRFAEANHYDVRFEALNGGREGINSSGIAAVAKEELLPLDPDLAVYYEGSNQFFSATRLVSPPIPPRSEIDPHGPAVEHKLPAAWRNHLAIANLVDRALMGFQVAGEPVKPSYRLLWPKGVDERNPNPDSPDLPLQLPAIVKDLDAIRTSLNSVGAPLFLSSFDWFTPRSEGLPAVRRPLVYHQLNTELWPLRYGDIRRLADFQNRVFHNYAAARKIGYLDVASIFPRDADLFEDAIHLTEAGDRLRAWIFFQQLVPAVRALLDSGRLPREAAHGLPPFPAWEAVEEPTACTPPPGPFRGLAGLSLDQMVEHPGSTHTIDAQGFLRIATETQQWAYAEQFPLRPPAGQAGSLWIRLRARVLRGQIGFGVLDHVSQDFQVERLVDPTPDMQDIYLPVPDPARAEMLVVRNTAAGGVASTLVLEGASLATPAAAPGM